MIYLFLNYSDVSGHERETVSSIMNVVEIQTKSLDRMQDDHSGGATEIEKHSQTTFGDRYMVCF